MPKEARLANSFHGDVCESHHRIPTRSSSLCMSARRDSAWSLTGCVIVCAFIANTLPFCVDGYSVLTPLSTGIPTLSQQPSQLLCNGHRPQNILARSTRALGGLCMRRRDGAGGGPQSGKHRQTDSLSAKTYNYVQGGFEEKTAPVGNGNSTSMYAAFDSALRASNYNMFCSPLKPVNAPTQFKASSPSANSAAAGQPRAQKWEEPAEEDPEVVRQRIVAEYTELDKLMGAETQGMSKVGGKPVIKKLRKKENRGTIIVSQQKQPVVQEEVEEEVEEVEPDEFQEQIAEGYEELQKLLALQPKGRTRRRTDSARFTGNMTQHRIDGAFKAVTVKDPLKRVYASKLKGESAPTVGSSEAVRRPGKPSSDGKEDVVVGDLLSSLRAKPQPAAAGQGPGPQGARGPKTKAKAKANAGVQKMEGKGASVQRGAKGTVVINHSTNIEGLLEVLQRLSEIDGIQTVVPGRLSAAKGRAPRLGIRVTAQTVDGFKCIARKGSQVQEVFVVCDLDPETMEAAIAWSL